MTQTNQKFRKVERQRGFAVSPVAAGCAVLLISVAGAAHAQQASAEVVVTGIRASIESAIATKRNADGIVEALSAEDIGKLPDSRMIEAAARRGYLLATKAKAFTKAMISERDIVIAMDRENYSEILLIAGGQQGNVKLLSDFLDASWPRDVPDPYHGGEAGFEYVLDMLEAAGPKLLGEPKILGE